MSNKTKDRFLLCLYDANTFCAASDSTAVVRGQWTDGEVKDTRTSLEDALTSGAKEVLTLNEANLLKIKQKMPELWEPYPEE